MAYKMEWDYGEAMACNPEFKQSDIDELKRWIQNHSPSTNIPTDVSESMLLCFHNACNWVMEDTKKCIKAYYAIREKAPEHFDDRDMNMDEMKEAARAVEFALLPERTDDGCIIIYHGLKDPLPENYKFNRSVKMLFMTIDRCIIEHGPINGCVFLFDMKYVKLGHLPRVNLNSLAKFFTYIQDGMPVKIKRINIMNTVSFFDKVMTLMKPFMKKELVSLLNLYQSNVDLDKFYKEVLPKRCLPPAFGGEAPEISILSDKNVEKITALKTYFEEEEKHRYKFTKKSKKANKIDKGLQDLSID